MIPSKHISCFALLILLACSGCNWNSNGSIELLHVSYDPTREFFQEYNTLFSQYWLKKNNQNVIVLQSHGGSSKQARAVREGLEADIVSLALGYDIDAIAKQRQLLPDNWQSRLPENSAPYTSTIVFLVRKGNPKHIRDWDDLIRPDIEVITPNPKTSGGARWNYLAAWGYAVQKHLGHLPERGEILDNTAEDAAYTFLKQLFQNVPILDSGARAATTTFAQRGIGDVLVTWENEAFLAQKKLGHFGLEMVVPSISILAEPPVAWVDAVTDARNTTAIARAYLENLYSPEGQRLAAKHHFRPCHPEYADPDDMAKFQEIRLFTLDDIFGDWQQTQARHFSDKGLFDRIYMENMQEKQP